LGPSTRLHVFTHSGFGIGFDYRAGLELEHDDLMINLNVDQPLESLHSDPRFQELARRVGIPQ
jgi:hypothetical protein